MTVGFDISKAPPEKPYRIAVFENDEGKRHLLARVTLTVREDAGNIQVDGPSEDGAKRIGEFIRKFTRGTANDQSEPGLRARTWAERWSGLVAALETEGFGIEDISAGDHEIKVEFDLQTGRVVGMQTSLHDFALSDEPLARRVMQSIGGALKNIPNEVAQDIEAAVAGGHLETIASTINRAAERGAFNIFPTQRLLAALFSFDVGQFAEAERRQLREIRMRTAQVLKRYEAAGTEAEALLREAAELFDDEQRGALEMIIAMATLKRGNKEAALHTWRQLLKPPTSLDAANRAWAWRNISMALARENPEARHAAKCSADAFLEAGDLKEAGTSLMRLVDCLLYEDPPLAIKTLEEIVALTDREGLQNRGLRAAAFHARANRLLQLGRHAEALRDAKDAVQLWRGLIGNEEQLISSLHLAALEAKTSGQPAEAERFEEEAERLTDEIDKPHFKLARRVIALLQNFDENEAAKLLHDAKEQGNREVIAGVRVAQATKNPNLSETERLSLMEDTLAYLDKAGAREAEKRPTMLALAGELLRIGEADRSDEWYRKLLAANPLDDAALPSFVNSLWRREKWDEAIPLLERQIQLRGKMPGFLYAYGRSLLEAGKFSEAVTALTESLKLATADSDIEKAARKLRDEALNNGGTIQTPAPPKLVTIPVTRDEFDKAMDAFARLISADQRMSFWTKGKGTAHSWVRRPEKKAQSLLHSFLKGHFGDRVNVLEELASGAGRLDVYLQFYGGLMIILELKMCGRTYSAPYASAGENQIRHYMENRHSHLGYLIVFDARSTDFGKPLIRGSGQFTIFEKFIDVRPTVKAGQGSVS